MLGYNGTYKEIIRNAVVVFGSVFNDIVIQRPNSEGGYDDIKVPLSYGPKEKFIARSQQDPDLERASSIVLPRISFEMTTMEYDSTRKKSSIGKVTKQIDNTKRVYHYNPVPYNVYFSLNIMTRHSNDGVQILEHILPFFTPDIAISMKLSNELDIVEDVPITLVSIINDDQYEGEFYDRRTLIWTLDFSMKLNIYGPVKEQGVIQKAIANAKPVDTDSVFGFDG